ncbi:MAG TPA: M20/M25/M40 family metallo-hydrolase [Pyrinomonadaceae bacterium]
MRTKFLGLLLTAALFASSATAQQKIAAQGDAPDAARLREHVTRLASNKFEGRRTGTQGAMDAAFYIAVEFARLGLLPGGDEANVRHPQSGASERLRGYVQAFPYVAGVAAGKANSMLLSTRAARAAGATATTDARPSTLDLRLGEDWMPLGFSANARVENAPIAFVGYGITSSELSHDDYKETNAQGRIAVAFTGTPDGDNPHGRFLRVGQTRFKAAAARDHGARALVLIAREENFRDDKLSRLAYDNAGGDAGLPVVAVSRQAAAQMLGLSVVGLSELERSLGGGSATERRADATSATSATTATTTKAVGFAPPEGSTLILTTDIVRQNAPAYNVVGVLEGSDPKLKDEAILIGAHYDHLGRGGDDSLAGRDGDIHHGADDNASGAAALVELARLFSLERARLRRTVVFVAFGAEEEGLLGSSFYVRHPFVPIERTVAMLNMDMIGRLRDERLIIGGVGTASEWRDWITQANEKLDLKITDGTEGRQTDGDNQRRSMPVVYGANGQVVATATARQRFTLALNEDGFGPSDHSSFYAQKIPVLFFFTGTHEDYHKPSDTADRLNYEGHARIVAFIREIVRSLDRSQQRPTFNVARRNEAQARTGFRVYLGTVPSYAETTDGMKLDGVREDSPASKAGLKAGDRIVRMAGRDVRNVYDYTYALSEMQARQEYEIEVIRGDERLRLKITPTARK